MLLNSKYSTPECPSQILERSRLLDQFGSANEFNVLTVSAPAGYGKTTLVANWAAAQDHPVAWYSLDTTDNEAGQFARYLVESVHMATGRGAQSAHQYVLAAEQVSASAAINYLLNDLRALPSTLDIVLDDLHTLKNEDILDIIQFFLKHLPMGVRVIITSRTLPTLGLASLRMQGKLVEITQHDLALSRDEIERLIDNRLPFAMTPQQLNRLVNLSEGWAPVIQLFLLSVKSEDGMENLLTDIEQGHRHILDYLAEEVVSTLNDGTRRLLSSASLLNRFDAAMVQEICGYTNAQEELEQAVDRGLFVQPLDSSNRWFRFHSLFAKFLQRTLSDAEMQQLHRKAYQVWLDKKVEIEALRHARKAQAPELICDLLRDCGQDIYNKGHYRALEDCFEFIGDEALIGEPSFALLAARVARNSFDYSRVERLLGQAEACILRDAEAEWEQFEGSFATVRAQAAIAQGEVANAREYAQEALELLPSSLSADIAAATLVIAETSFCLGHLEDALEQLERVERMTRSTEDWGSCCWAICQQAEILFAQGLPYRAEDRQRAAEQLLEDKHLRGLPIAEFVYRLKAQLLWEWYRLDEVVASAQQGMTINRIFGDRWLLQEYSILAKVALAEGKRDQCETWVETLEQLLAKESYHRDWVAHADYACLAIWEALGNKEAIERWYRRAPPVADNPTNHFEQRHGRNHIRALMNLGRLADANRLLRRLSVSAKRHNLQTDKLRNLIMTAQIKWLQQQRNASLIALHDAIRLSIESNLTAGFVRCGKPLLVMLKALMAEHHLTESERERADQLLELIQRQPELSGQLRIEIDLSLVDEILAHEDTPEMLKHSPLTPKEWQVFNLIYLGFSNAKIAEHMSVAPSTIKTHIRAIYQKLELRNRAEAVDLAKRLLSAVQGG